MCAFSCLPAWLCANQPFLSCSGDHIPNSECPDMNYINLTQCVWVGYCEITNRSCVSFVLASESWRSKHDLNTHTPYLCGFEWSDTVTWCMVEWCTQNLRRDGNISRGTSHATLKERYQYTTSMDINNTRYERTQSLIQNHMRHVRIESAREHRITLYKSCE